MSINVSDLPQSDRPHYRLSTLGPKYLTNVELLALIIGTNKGITIAQTVLSQFKTRESLQTATIQELTSIKGIGTSVAGHIIACLEFAKRFSDCGESIKKNKSVTSPDEMFEHIKSKVTNYYKEHFFVCSLDTRNNLIAVDEISVGTLTSSLVHPREAFEIAIKRHAAHIILAHNHPSGETDPSEDDLKITKRLVDAGKIMGIDVIDHLIITTNTYLSFKEKCLI